MQPLSKEASDQELMELASVMTDSAMELVVLMDQDSDTEEPSLKDSDTEVQSLKDSVMEEHLMKDSDTVEP